eukprot:CAMPEP_0172732812 /NCGR_PEP_ID=MMETSP1074-20121228/105392_1 /TAXON_ID=2916 /ORGANISM="Ceratium fusus, Strain PA161109" /LENGTH=40 /DNA_ID= /DNA_START= /DNA_END= /DNA_ORIENTATION=
MAKAGTCSNAVLPAWSLTEGSARASSRSLHVSMQPEPAAK